jgi:SET domain-containing protein
MNIIIKDSEIDGKGVFAKRDFKEGEIIIDWADCSEKLTKEQFDKLSEDEKRYVSFVDEVCVLMKSPAKYVNHSCDANTYVVDFCDVAKKDIKSGEEITGDYISEDAPISGFKCNCGSNKCKGILI